MAKPEPKLIIELGATGLRALRCNTDGGPPEVLATKAVEYGGSLRGGSRAALLAEGFRQLAEDPTFANLVAHVCLSGEMVFSKLVSLPPVSADLDRIKQIIGYEARQQIPFSLDTVVWDHQLVCGRDDDMEVVLAAVKRELLSEVLAAAERVGLAIESIDFSVGALYNLARASAVGGEVPEIMLHVGGETSVLLILDGNNLAFRTLPMGGVAVTQAIARHFKLSAADAEILKLRHGYVALGGSYEEAGSEVAAETARICRQVSMRLYQQIRQSIAMWRRESGAGRPMPETIYLCGGGSAMPYLPEFLSERLSCRVEHFNPFCIGTLAPSVDMEALSASTFLFGKAMGVAVRLSVPCPVLIDLLPQDNKRELTASRRMPYLVAAAALWVSIMSALFLLNRQRSLERHELVVVERARLAQLTEMSEGLKAVERKTSNLAARNEQYGSVLGSRNAMTVVLNALDGARPASVDILKFEPIHEPLPESSSTGGTTSIFFVKQEKEESVPTSTSSIKGFYLIAQMVSSLDDWKERDDIAEVPKAFLTALTDNPAFVAGDESKITAYGSDGNGTVRFEMQVKLAQHVRAW